MNSAGASVMSIVGAVFSLAAGSLGMMSFLGDPAEKHLPHRWRTRAPLLFHRPEWGCQWQGSRGIRAAQAHCASSPLRQAEPHYHGFPDRHPVAVAQGAGGAVVKAHSIDRVAVGMQASLDEESAAP